VASNTQEKLLDDLDALIAQLPPTAGDVGVAGDLQGTVAGESGVKAGVEGQTSGGMTYESAASTAISVAKSGLGLVPLLSGLFGLFGGGDSTATTTAPVKYALPARLDFETAESGAGLASVDYDQTGRLRLLPKSDGTAMAGLAGPGGVAGQAGLSEYAGQGGRAGQNGYGGLSGLTLLNGQGGQAGSGGPTSVGASSTRAAAAAPQITVNVQAMDARSFMDRSTDIAAAVRDAMLNLNSINDVVAEL
jgi:hypothetical protein